MIAIMESVAIPTGRRRQGFLFDDGELMASRLAYSGARDNTAFGARTRRLFGRARHFAVHLLGVSYENCST